MGTIIFFNDLFSDPYDCARSYQLRLLAYCFEECKNPTEVQQYEDFIKEVVNYLEKKIPNQNLERDLMRGNRSLLCHDNVAEIFVTNLKNRAKQHEMTQFLEEMVEQGQALPITVFSALIDILNDPEADLYTKSSAADALGEATQSGQALPEDMLKALIDLLNDPKADSDARGSATNALGDVAQSGQALSEDALKALIALLNDPEADPYAKLSAVKAPGKVAQSGQALSGYVLKALIAFLNDPEANLDAKGFVAYALGEVAQSGQALPEDALKGLIDALEKHHLLNDTSNRIISSLESISQANLPELTESNCVLMAKLCFLTSRAFFCQNDVFYMSSKQKIIPIKTNKDHVQKIKKIIGGGVNS